jgi:uncharacterized protein YbjT (DUF2867 family)
MSHKNTIAVIGSMGAQGSGLVNAAVADANAGVAIRAITRDPGKERAKEIAARGVEVVKADLDDPESLRQAFTGAYGVYAVTNFWEHFQAGKEIAQARNIADAARATGVEHVIWSTLEDTRALMRPDDTRMPILQKTYRVPHFDGKAEANASFRDLPVTFLVTSFYWDNLYTFGLGPKKGDDGQHRWALPMGESRLAGIASEDIGAAAYGLFKAGQQYIGKTIGIVGEHLTIREMADKLSSGLAIGPITYDVVDADVYRSRSGDELGNMFQVYRDFEKAVLAARSLEATRQLHPQVLDFDRWVAKNKHRILSAMVVGA